MPAPMLAGLIGRGTAAAGAGGGASSMALNAAMSGQIPDLSKKLEQLAKPLAALDQVLGAMVSKTQEAVKTLSMLTDTIRSMGDSMAKFVSKSNPALVEKFNIVMNDAEAVIGRILTPAFEALTRAASGVGDTLAVLEPIFKRFSASMGGVIEGIFKTITDVLKENAPLIEGLLTLVGHAIKGIAKVFDWAMKQLSGALKFVNTIMKSLGFGQDVKPDASARGSAVRSVSIGGSGMDLYNQAATAAFMQNPDAEKEEDPTKQAVGKLDEIKTFLDTNLTATTLGALLATALKNLLDSWLASSGMGKQAQEDYESAKAVAADPMEFLRILRDMAYGH
jgi:hypothetical protein